MNHPHHPYRPSIKHFWQAVVLLLMSVALAQPYGEAPQLAEQVAADTLPPVAERLPENPLVVEPFERIGTYGGTWRSAIVGGPNWILLSALHDSLVRWDAEWNEVIPNLAESVEVSDDGRVYTFNLRPGIKWSDGVPFNADDIMFWYEDVFLNETLTPVQSSTFVTDGEPVVVEKLDDHTVQFTFTEPNGLFLQRLAAPFGDLTTLYPRHYLEQFHTRYNPDVMQQVRAAGFDNWLAFFGQQADMFGNADKPVLSAWLVSTPYGAGARAVVTRNPYYWKVDSAGNQLPYIDEIVYDNLQDDEVVVLRVLSGEIDMISSWNGFVPSNRAVFFDNTEQGDYRLDERIAEHANEVVVYLNLNHPDAAKRQVFQNKDFRIGLSQAIDRQEIIDLIFFGAGTPAQVAPRPESAFYNEQMSEQYTGYDVDEANRRLDEVLPERDSEGFRLGPDGERFRFVVEVPPAQTWVDTLELIQGYWRSVGIDMQIRTVEWSLFGTRIEAGQHDAVVWSAEGGIGVVGRTDHYLPSAYGSQYWAPRWYNWYRGSSPAEEPPAAVREQMRLYDQLAATADEAEQATLMEEILAIAAEQYYMIGISSPANGYNVVSNRLHNVPRSIIEAWNYPTPAPTNPQQYFIQDTTSRTP